jgi:trehalose 6-phosphate synthase
VTVQEDVVTSHPAGRTRLLTVSNRGPVEFGYDEDGNLVETPGAGGLATALHVAADLYPTTWLSSPLSETDRAIAAGEIEHPGLHSHFVLTDEEQYDLFYGAFANETLWPLQHALAWPDELPPERRVRSWHDGYIPVNQAFADAVVEEIDAGGVRAVMIHDYHFYLVPRMVRSQRPDAYLQHFVHIPWPHPKEWSRMDNRTLRAMVDGLLGNDSLVFQTPNDAHNFRLTAQFALGAEIDEESGFVKHRDRMTRVWSNGISVDPEELDEVAMTPEFSRYRYLLRAAPGQKMIMRVDRLDMTKNVVRGFEAYERLLEDHAELRGRVMFLALLVPTKVDIPMYSRYQEEALAKAQEINRRFGNLHWKPVRIMFEHNRVQALAAMSLYDVMLVNPVADGMNLVAKEGPVLNTHNGVLVLSTAAGAYADLGCGALGVDPYDVEQTAEALYTAVTMPGVERRERAESLRRAIRGKDLKAWFQALLNDIEANAPAEAGSTAA